MGKYKKDSIFVFFVVLKQNKDIFKIMKAKEINQAFNQWD